MLEDRNEDSLGLVVGREWSKRLRASEHIGWINHGKNSTIVRILMNLRTLERHRWVTRSEETWTALFKRLLLWFLIISMVEYILSVNDHSEIGRAHV